MRIIITGELTVDDLKDFARLLRKIEQRNPTKIYGLILQTPNLTIEEAKELVSKVYVSTLKKTKKR